MDKLMAPCRKSIELEVFYDREKIQFLYDNCTKIMNKLGDEFHKTGALGSQLKCLKGKRKARKIVKFGVPVSSNKYGRLRPLSKSDKSMVEITRPVRQFLVREYATDIDIVGCHIVLADDLYLHMFNERMPQLKEWNSQREKVYQTCIEYSTKPGGITRDDAKKLGFTFLYQGSVDNRFKELGLDKDHPELQRIYKTIFNLTAHCKKLAEEIKSEYPETWDKLPYCQEKGEDRKDIGKFSSLLQNMERLCVTEIYNASEELGFKIIDFCYDGVLVSCNDDVLTEAQEEQLCKRSMELIKQNLGFSVNVLAKPMDHPKTDELFRWYLGDNELNANRCDHELVKSLVPSTAILDLEDLKHDREEFQKLTEKEIEELVKLVLKKYVIRIMDKWHFINCETGIIVNPKGLSKDAFQNTTLGTILSSHYGSPSIPCYTNIVFKDPSDVKKGEYNEYGNTLPYERENQEPLTDEELEKIQDFLYHLKNILCGNDEEIYHYLMGIFKHKLLKPFEVNHNSKAIIMLGLEGSGKTTPLTNLFKRFFGDPYVNGQVGFKTVANPTGFTDALEHKLVAFMNEIPEYNCKNSELFENFKAMVTDGDRRSRRMFKGECAVNNSILYFLSTNNRNCFPCSATDRRYLFLESDSKHRCNYKYFTKLNKTIRDHYLLIARYIITYDYDLNTILPIPDNQFRLDAKKLKLGTIGEFILSRLEDKIWNPNEEPAVQLKPFYEEYRIFCRSQMRNSKQYNKFRNELQDKYRIRIEKASDNTYYAKIYNHNEFYESIGWKPAPNSDSASPPPYSPSHDPSHLPLLL